MEVAVAPKGGFNIEKQGQQKKTWGYSQESEDLSSR